MVVHDSFRVDRLTANDNNVLYLYAEVQTTYSFYEQMTVDVNGNELSMWGSSIDDKFSIKYNEQHVLKRSDRQSIDVVVDGTLPNIDAARWLAAYIHGL